MKTLLFNRKLGMAEPKNELYSIACPADPSLFGHVFLIIIDLDQECVLI